VRSGTRLSERSRDAFMEYFRVDESGQVAESPHRLIARGYQDQDYERRPNFFGFPFGDFGRRDYDGMPPLEGPRALVMPRAIPMGYGEQRYDTFLREVTATSPSGGSEPKRDEGPRWILPARTSRVSYRVNLRAMEREVYSASDASRLREGYLSALGYSVFAFVDGFESRPARLRVAGPEAWPVFSTLAPRWPYAAGEEAS
jgi:hypothetical protein